MHAPDKHVIDELHAFIAPKLIGGKAAPAAIAGLGIADMSNALQLQDPEVNLLAGDIHVHARVSY